MLTMLIRYSRLKSVEGNFWYSKTMIKIEYSSIFGCIPLVFDYSVLNMKVSLFNFSCKE